MPFPTTPSEILWSSANWHQFVGVGAADVDDAWEKTLLKLMEYIKAVSKKKERNKINGRKVACGPIIHSIQSCHTAEPAIGGGFEATLNIPNSISVGYGLNLSEVLAIGDNNIDANVSINSIVFSTSISINITSIIMIIIINMVINIIVIDSVIIIITIIISIISITNTIISTIIGISIIIAIRGLNRPSSIIAIIIVFIIESSSSPQLSPLSS